jgi:hypothetical protein
MTQAAVQGRGRGRALWLGGALAATLLAAQWVSGEDGGTDVEQTVESRTPRKELRTEQSSVAREAANEAEQLQLERLDRRKFSAQAGDIFRHQSWAPPPPPPSKPPPPSPPPLQFKYLGRVTEGDETRVFLALAERNYIVKPGENIDSQYRMDEVNDHAITLTYLPLNAKQMLAIAGPGDVR